MGPIGVPGDPSCPGSRGRGRDVRRACRGAQPAAVATATSLYRGPTGNKLVAITIDCGSDRGYAASILNTLATKGVKCSFGMTGTWAEANPDLLRRMVTEGHHLMNHENDLWHVEFHGYRGCPCVMGNPARCSYTGTFEVGPVTGVTSPMTIFAVAAHS